MAKETDQKKRDFLQLSTVTLGAVGTAAFIWPFIKSMNPAEDTLAAVSYTHLTLPTTPYV